MVLAAQVVSHDPTKPIDATNFEQNGDDNSYDLRIDSLVTGKSSKLAIVNGHSLHIGDKLNDLVVVDIYPYPNPYAVKLRDKNNTEITIKIPYSEIKQQTTVKNTINKQ